jgi:hypothetical protein
MPCSKRGLGDRLAFATVIGRPSIVSVTVSMGEQSFQPLRARMR